MSKTTVENLLATKMSIGNFIHKIHELCLIRYSRIMHTYYQIINQCWRTYFDNGYRRQIVAIQPFLIIVINRLILVIFDREISNYSHMATALNPFLHAGINLFIISSAHWKNSSTLKKITDLFRTATFGIAIKSSWKT